MSAAMPCIARHVRTTTLTNRLHLIRTHGRNGTMAEKWKDREGVQNFWYRGKVTRRRVVGWGGGAIGAMMLAPAPWRAAFGAVKPYKIGSEQPLSGAGAAGGKTALVGLQ